MMSRITTLVFAILTLASLYDAAASPAFCLTFDDLRGTSIQLEIYSIQKHKMLDNSQRDEIQTIKYHIYSKTYISDKGRIFQQSGFSPNSQPFLSGYNLSTPDKATERTDNENVLLAFTFSNNVLTRVTRLTEGYSIGNIQIAEDKKSCKYNLSFQNDPITGRVVDKVSYPDQKGRPYQIIYNNLLSGVCTIKPGNIFSIEQ
jgi:hypothetical protein